MRNKKKKGFDISLGPVITIIILTLMVIVLSSVFSIFEIEAEKTRIIDNGLETTLVTVNNVLTIDGIKTIISNSMVNLNLFEPFFLLIMSLIAIGIGEASGLFQIVFKPLKKMKKEWLTFLTLLIGLTSSIVGEYSYIILIPLIALIYQYTNKKPFLGILTMFIGITVGYGTGILASYDDYILGTMTQAAANVDLDQNFVYNLYSNIFIMIFSVIALLISGMFIIKKFLEPKIGKNEVKETEYKESKKGLFFTLLAFVSLMLIVIYMIIPGFYKSGLLLTEGDHYIVKLFKDGSPFKDGFMFVYLFIFMVCGFIYGKISKNIENTNQYSIGLSKNFENLGYLFVLLFFTAQLIGILEWTNLGEVVTINLLNLLSRFDFSAIILIIVTFVLVIIMSILMPFNTVKWSLLSPVLVPLFMRANVTPSFTQFVFSAADSIGKAITPFFIYFIITLAFLEKYNTDGDNKITIFGTLKKIMPTILMFAVVWFAIIIGWYITGLPTGIGVHPTM